MCKYLILLLFIYSSYSFSKDVAPENLMFMCKAEAFKIFKNWGVNKGKWRRKGSYEIISPTDKIGEWVSLEIKPKNEIKLSKAKADEQIIIEFSDKCKENLKVIKYESKKQYKAGDNFLQNKIKGAKGLIYLWSPLMPLSLKGIREIQEVSKKLKLKVIYLLDPNYRGKIENRYLKYAKKILSFELIMRNAYLHFPTILSFKDGKIGEQVKYGYENRDNYEKDIKSMFNYN